MSSSSPAWALNGPVLRPPVLRKDDGLSLRHSEDACQMELGYQVADGTQSGGGLSPKRCNVSVHRVVDPEPVENVSGENDMVEASEWRFWECWRDDDVFGPLDAMITRGWGDKRQVAIPKDWAMRPGPDQGLYAKRRAAVSKGLKEKHAARKRNPQYGFDLGVVRAKGEL